MLSLLLTFNFFFPLSFLSLLEDDGEGNEITCRCHHFQNFSSHHAFVDPQSCLCLPNALEIHSLFPSPVILETGFHSVSGSPEPLVMLLLQPPKY